MNEQNAQNNDDLLAEDTTSEETSTEVKQAPELSAAEKRVRELESKIVDYDIKLIEVRAFVRKLESEVKDIRQRAERDVQKAVDQKLSEFGLRLVPALDLFELSLKSTETGAKDFDSFVNGIRLIESEMKLAFEKLGFERIEKKGEAFDPHRHEALTQMPVTDADQDGKVIEVVKVGYSLSGRVIRPAHVIVGSFQEASI